MKSTHILQYLLLLGTAYSSQAQSPAAAAPADTARVYNHHLGLSVSPQLNHFLTANRTLPIGLIYRRQTQPNRAWRARAVGQYQFRSGDAPLLIGNAYREHNASLELAWGKERWLPLSQRFTAYVGGEVGAGLAVYRLASEFYRNVPRDNPGFPSVTQKAVGEQLEKQNTASVFLQALVGIRYTVTRRLGVEAEAGLPVSFSRRKWRVDGTEYFVADRVPTGAGNLGDNTYYTLTAQLKPISRLQLYFVF